LYFYGERVIVVWRQQINFSAISWQGHVNIKIGCNLWSRINLLLGAHELNPSFSGILFAQSIFFCVVFCWSLSFCHISLCHCLYCLCFDLRLLITPLVFSNFSPKIKPQELLTLPEHLSSPPVFSGVRVTRSLVLDVCLVDRCLSFCTFSFGQCVVCSSAKIYTIFLFY
jgi:hypothetical protein